MIAANQLFDAINAGAFVVLLLAIGALRGAGQSTQRTDQIAAAANDLERLTIDLETGERGYIITGQQGFLEPYTSALSKIPGQELILNSLLRDPAEQRRDRSIVRLIEQYAATSMKSDRRACSHG